jgi:arylsulfatase/uncharacterized sulfatase
MACASVTLLAAAAALATPPLPNIVLVVGDDVALMDFGAYGGEARTPTIDALAARGVMFTNIHASPFCAPSRAMLLTGMDNHLTGVATIREVLPPEHVGQPGYTMHLEPGVETLATRLKRAGYRSYMTGKWHLGQGEGDLPDAHGFDRSFVLDASGADHWEQRPYLPYYRTAPWFEDGAPATLPADFYSSTFIVDKMLDYLGSHHDSEAPFFAYVAFLAVHIPVQAPAEFTARYDGVYDVGWDVVRRRRWERAQALGLIPAGAPLATKPERLRDWESLNAEERALAAKSMAVNAGMLEAMDHHLRRLVDHLKRTGQYENTLFVITSDNGPEAGNPWTNAVMRRWMAWQGYTRELETLGQRRSYPVIGPEWASAAAGPSRLFKFHAAEGGLRVPLILAGPGVPEGSIERGFATIADVAPTLLDVIDHDGGERGSKQMTGRSLVPVLFGEKGAAYGPDEAIGFETSGQAALFRGDYKLVRNMPPFGDGIWRLFDLAVDPGESRDLGSRLPELLGDLMHEYRLYANRVGVIELPAGYDVERQIGANVARRLIGFYWIPLLLGTLMVLGLVLAVIWLITRHALSRGG